ncbi:hypothetical protein JT06_02545 [Desulfobulbus sp. Tol-SR]|nr:hypothetical protein JT06_02545 [Desulfobulbus sp. Tol-SR]
MSTFLIPLALPVQPWAHDHRFADRTILPAVESMRLLALTATEACPTVDPKIMTDTAFTRFVEIAPDAAVLEILVRLTEVSSGVVRAGLLSRSRVKAMTRLVSHCDLTFAAAPSPPTEVRCLPAPPAANSALEISVDRIYRDLVPFGPTYRTLRDRLRLTADMAWGRVRAPELPRMDGVRGPLGNPFPLDGAMHAACVHGQRLVDFIPFPVGFAARVIARPTEGGESYAVRVRLRSRADNELVYDLAILDEGGRLRETVTALRMRDVSGGRIRPPAWVKAS